MPIAINCIGTDNTETGQFVLKWYLSTNFPAV